MDQEGKLRALTGLLFLVTVVVLITWNGLRKENTKVSQSRDIGCRVDPTEYWTSDEPQVLNLTLRFYDNEELSLMFNTSSEEVILKN